MQAIRFRAIAPFIGAATALLLFAAPAYAIGPGNAGSQCASHSCDAWALTGAPPPGGGGGNVVLPPPPPCQVAPVGDAHSGSQSIIAFYQGSGVVAQPSDQASPAGSPPASAGSNPLNAQDQGILSKAQQLVGENPMPRGEWYEVVATTPADQATCNKLPLYIWQQGNGDSAILAAGLPLPPATLAALLYRDINLPKVSKVVLSPQGTSDTNLPTSIQVALAQGIGSPILLTQQGIPYVVATAATALGAATVWATVTSLTITPGANAKTFNGSTCTQAHAGPNGHTVMLGSRYTAKQMAAIGPGGNVDCGVTYYGPGSFPLTVTVNWQPCWIKGPLPAGSQGPPANCNTNVPGARNLLGSTSNTTVAVRAIQSVNG